MINYYDGDGHAAYYCGPATRGFNIINMYRRFFLLEEYTNTGIQYNRFETINRNGRGGKKKTKKNDWYGNRFTRRAILLYKRILDLSRFRMDTILVGFFFFFWLSTVDYNNNNNDEKKRKKKPFMVTIFSKIPPPPRTAAVRHTGENPTQLKKRTAIFG